MTAIALRAGSPAPFFRGKSAAGTAALAALALLALAGCEERRRPKPVVPPASEPAADAGSAAGAVSEAPPPAATTTLAGAAVWPATTARAKIATSKGDIIVELYPEKAPRTVANFLQYATEGHYDRLIVHRVVAGFVIQGGGYNQYFSERPTRSPIPYEGDNGLKNLRTTIAMARTEDPDSATSQWFINLRDNEKLDHFVNDLGPRYGYAVFGRVIEGMEVVDAIGAAPTGAAGPFESEVPLETVTILRVDPVGAP